MTEQIQLAEQQAKAVGLAREWFKSDDPRFFILNGYAGTGKTTIAKLAPALITDAGPDSVIYAALTGKAALQLRRKGCSRATTLHKLLYSPIERDRTQLLELAKELRDVLEAEGPDSPRADELKAQVAAERRRVRSPLWEAKNTVLDDAVKLIVVDESSMVDQRIFDDLMELNKPVLFMGDPFQLPPVFGESPIMSHRPNAVLTDVHRQALDNPVLRAATDLRASGHLTVLPGQDLFRVIHSRDAGYPDYAAADQVLCGRNDTRRTLNQRMRRRLIDSGKLAPGDLHAAVGDKLVFLRNDHDEEVFNGTVATLSAVAEGSHSEPDHLIIDCDDAEPAILSYEVWAGVLKGEDPLDAPRKHQVVDFAYALTTHKAQGSEWDSVLVHHEPMAHGTDGRRWLYTAITRARRACTVVTRDTRLTTGV